MTITRHADHQGYPFMLKKPTLATFISIVAGIFLAGPASASKHVYPERAVKLVVAGPAGGGTDYTARLVAEKLSSILEQTVFVENQAGASGLIGARYVKNSKPDGYTLLLGQTSTNATLPIINAAADYDAEADFTPISLLSISQELLVVNQDSPFHSLQDFLAAAKARPAYLTYGTPGIGQSQHLLALKLERAFGISLQHIPYVGSAPALRDLLGGQIDSMLVTPGAAMPLIDSGRLRVLALSSAKRNPLLPNVPTFEEAGAKGLIQYSWMGIFGPKGLPPSIQGRLSLALQAAFKDHVLADKISAIYSDPIGSDASSFRVFQQREIEGWHTFFAENPQALQQVAGNKPAAHGRRPD